MLAVLFVTVFAFAVLLAQVQLSSENQVEASGLQRRSLEGASGGRPPSSRPPSGRPYPPRKPHHGGGDSDMVMCVYEPCEVLEVYPVPPLPYPYDSLELNGEGIDEQTMTFHHDRHFAGYTNKMNKALADLKDVSTFVFVLMISKRNQY